MWVRASERGLGIGRRLLGELEAVRRCRRRPFGPARDEQGAHRGSEPLPLGGLPRRRAVQRRASRTPLAREAAFRRKRKNLLIASGYPRSVLVLIGVGFLAGVITAISPCVLPVLPILLAGGATGRKPLRIIAGPRLELRRLHAVCDLAPRSARTPAGSPPEHRDRAALRRRRHAARSRGSRS